MMKTRSNWRARYLGIAAASILLATPYAFGQDLVKGNVPFAFRVGSKTLPAGEYSFRVDRVHEAVIIASPDGYEALTNFITTLAAPQHTEATDTHIVFDKVGDTYTLSEIWEPGGTGILVHATKGPHEHHVLHLRRDRT